jgi:glycosyltransferase involved in cell wall biosynthesis
MSSNPIISVVICSYNRQDYITPALESLTKQDISPASFEVIVIDNNSSDNTKEITLRFIEAHPDHHIRYVFEAKQGLSHARNTGISEAKGMYIAYMDDDGQAEKNYIKNLINAFSSHHEYQALGGKILPNYESGHEPEWMSFWVSGLVSKVDWGNTYGEFFKYKYPFGCNMAFHKNILEKAGGFNTDLGSRSDDKYIFTTLRRMGVKILYAPDIVVYHSISRDRMTDSSIQKISKDVGKTEYVRLLHQGLINKFIKGLEYLIKLGVAFPIALFYLIHFAPSKGKYIILNRWWVLQGYIQQFR